MQNESMQQFVESELFIDDGGGGGVPADAMTDEDGVTLIVDEDGVTPFVAE